jgi:hypothetical protein
MLLQAIQRLHATRLHAGTLCDEIGTAGCPNLVALLFGGRLGKGNPGKKTGSTEDARYR